MIKQDVKGGDLYQDDSGRVYRVAGLWTSPAVIMEDLETKEQVTFGIDSLLAQQYTRLAKVTETVERRGSDNG